MQGSKVMRQSGAETLVTEEPYELIAHVRDCGGAYKCRLFSRSFGTLYWFLSLIVVGSRTLGPWLGPYLPQRQCLLRA